jgi:hypothetical protein
VVIVVVKATLEFGIFVTSVLVLLILVAEGEVSLVKGNFTRSVHHFRHLAAWGKNSRLVRTVQASEIGDDRMVGSKCAL